MARLGPTSLSKDASMMPDYLFALNPDAPSSDAPHFCMRALPRVLAEGTVPFLKRARNNNDQATRRGANSTSAEIIVVTET